MSSKQAFSKGHGAAALSLNADNSPAGTSERSPSMDNANRGPFSAVKTYLTRTQVAERYPISVHTLAKLASQGRGPRFYKPTDKALYCPKDIEDWIEAAAVMPVAEPSPAVVRQPKAPPQYGRGRSSLPLPKGENDSAAARNGRKSLAPSPHSFLLRPKG